MAIMRNRRGGNAAKGSEAKVAAIRAADKECFSCTLLSCIHDWPKGTHAQAREKRERCRRAQALAAAGYPEDDFVTPEIRNACGTPSNNADDTVYGLLLPALA